MINPKLDVQSSEDSPSSEAGRIEACLCVERDWSAALEETEEEKTRRDKEVADFDELYQVVKDALSKNHDVEKVVVSNHITEARVGERRLRSEYGHHYN